MKQIQPINNWQSR